jgi:hypothetical protein
MQSIILGHFLVVGLPYQDLSASDWNKLTESTPVQLRRERFNPHDPLCISIRLEDQTRLGYLSREDNPVPSAILDQGYPLAARIVEISTGQHQPFPQELRVEVRLELANTPETNTGEGSTD